MTKLLKILKNGEFTYQNFKNLDELYKICGFRKNDNFQLVETVKISKYFYEVWGRTIGKDNTKNIYPFFIDEKINVFGNCVMLVKYNNEYIDFDLEKWEKKNMQSTIETLSSEIYSNEYYSDDNFNDEELKKDVYLYTSEEEADSEEEYQEK